MEIAKLIKGESEIGETDRLTSHLSIPIKASDSGNLASSASFNQLSVLFAVCLPRAESSASADAGFSVLGDARAGGSRFVVNLWAKLI